MAEGARVETAGEDSDLFGDSVMSVVSPARSIPEGSTVRKSGIEQQLRQTIRLRLHQQRLLQLNPRPLNKPRLLKLLTLLCEGLLEEREPGWATK